MITLEIAKQNLFQMKGLSYLEALQSKLELIKNQDKLELDINLIVIKKFENEYYLQYVSDDEKRIALAESTL
mgnify:CR=1 FL=1|jgi:hypothetical protein